MAGLILRNIAPGDRTWLEALLIEYFGTVTVISRGQLHDCLALAGMVAEANGEKVGLMLYRLSPDQLEVVSLISTRADRGIGRALLDSAMTIGADAGVDRCWLVTTNNNHNAINFYRHLGWHQVTTHVGAVDSARMIKPEIPQVDDRGIPIRDELEFECRLQS